MDLYAENILDHYKHPRHAGELRDPSATHEEVNLRCGDKVRLQLRIDGDAVAEIAWTGEGCAISQAGMSILSEEIAGKSLKDLETLDESGMRAMLGVPVGKRRLKCALLGLHTLKNALRAHRGQPPQSWQETVGNAAETR